MELVDMPKVSEEKELTKTQKDNLFESIVRGKDAIEEVETSRGKFKIKFPRVKDLEAIGKLTAYRMSGISAECFNRNISSLMEQVATLDVCVVSGPAWFENAKKQDNFSWSYVPSQDFIQEVYAKVLEFRFKVSKMFESDSGDTNTAVDNTKAADDSDEPGLFENMSSSTGSAR